MLLKLLKNFVIMLKLFKTTLKRAIQKTAEATGDLIGNKIANKIAKVSRNSPQNFLKKFESETEIPKERYISPEKRQKIKNDLS